MLNIITKQNKKLTHIENTICIIKNSIIIYLFQYLTFGKS